MNPVISLSHAASLTGVNQLLTPVIFFTKQEILSTKSDWNFIFNKIPLRVKERKEHKQHNTTRKDTVNYSKGKRSQLIHLSACNTVTGDDLN